MYRGECGGVPHLLETLDGSNKQWLGIGFSATLFVCGAVVGVRTKPPFYSRVRPRRSVISFA